MGLVERLFNQEELKAEEELDAAPDNHGVDPATLELYAVTDRTWLGDRTLAACVQQAIDGEPRSCSCAKSMPTMPKR